MLLFKRVIIFFGLLLFLIPFAAFAASLRYSENFNDQTLSQPTTGGSIVWKADYPGGLNAVTAEYITHYIWGTGRGGSGYCWKGAYDGVNLYAQWYIGTWPTNEMYTSMWLRYGNFRNLSGQTNLNLKKYYHYFNGGSYYTAASGYTAYSIYSAPTCGGGYYSTQGINYLDGNWHKWASYLNKTTGHFKLWIDDKLIHDYVNCHYAEWVSFYSFSFNAIDAEGQEGYDFEMDDIEVWDGMPSGTNIAPSVTIQSPTEESNYDETISSAITLGGIASDSDGTVTSVSYLNTANQESDTCTGTTSWTCSNIPLALGVNNIFVTATDDDNEDGSDLIIVTYSTGGDFTAPAVTVTSPESLYYTAPSATVTISGTASDDVAIKQHDWTCPTCTPSSGTVYGTSWSISNITISGSAYGPELAPGGDFDTDENWDYDTDWSIASGVATCTGAANNMGLQQDMPFVKGALYEIRYDIDSYTSGNLYISQWGFVGVGYTKLLTSSVGELTDEVYCREPSAPLRLVSDSWIGSLNYVRPFQKGTLNHFTITTYDTSDNYVVNEVYVNYYFISDRDLSISSGSGGRTVTCCSGSGGRTLSINN